ncbi:MAG: carbohydrate ABC transporter permease [Candidatus Ornithospirochaeta sp.]|nr:carbohydrate ABC transporter permease [Candidatus Ornithospirochaeta sp.]
MAQVQNKSTKWILFAVLIIVSAFVIFPILVVLLNSFKLKFYISDAPFSMPTSETFAGLLNYTSGLVKTGFFTSFGYSLWITVASVFGILLCTSMLGWYITRVHGKVTSLIYYLLTISMIVPFQMVMFSMSKIANILHLDNPIGIIVLYIGFGCGMATFMFAGFVKSIPLALEEAAMIDGAGPVRTFFQVVMPMMKPTAITLAILQTMWVWNDYLLPYLTLGTDYKTIPVAIQYLRGGYGSVDMGAMMAMLVLAMLPVIIFFLSCQKYIIKGVLAGAVKG